VGDSVSDWGIGDRVPQFETSFISVPQAPHRDSRGRRSQSNQSGQQRTLRVSDYGQQGSYHPEQPEVSSRPPLRPHETGESSRHSGGGVGTVVGNENAFDINDWENLVPQQEATPVQPQRPQLRTQQSRNRSRFQSSPWTDGAGLSATPQRPLVINEPREDGGRNERGGKSKSLIDKAKGLWKGKGKKGDK
jgi:hypothetical protein